MSPAASSALKFSVVAGPICALVLLLASGFFSGWAGVAASVRPFDPGDATRRVLIVEDGGESREVRWPASALDGISLPVDATGIPPRKLPEGAPRTSKSRYTLSFAVVTPDAGPRAVTTTSPRALALTTLLFLVLVAGRNMATSGSPFRFSSRPTVLPKALPPAGQPTRPRQRPTKGPPPRTRRRG